MCLKNRHRPEKSLQTLEKHRVYPARVGMDRIEPGMTAAEGCLPHTRGDRSYSKRTDYPSQRVYPTRVGMDRHYIDYENAAILDQTAQNSPDGRHMQQLFTPHAWGRKVKRKTNIIKT